MDTRIPTEQPGEVYVGNPELPTDSKWLYKDMSLLIQAYNKDCHQVEQKWPISIP